MSGIQQADMPADAAQQLHLCLDCGVDISHRRRDAQRCEPCSTNRNRQRANEHYSANRTAKLQYAKNRRQTPELKQIDREWRERNPDKVLASRERSKQRHREKTGYNPEGRTCEDCHADISRRGHRAKRCLACATPFTRTCIVCGANIGKRGPSKFCSEQCKVEDRQQKDSNGWTRVCIKCKETREYRAFRMHYNRRDPVCKSCEAKDARVYASALPVQERQRRRRIQGQREREKKANLPLEQRAMLRTKARRGHRRKLYGPDFNEDRLYSEQGGKCAICGTLKSLEALQLDHDHETHVLGTMLGLRGLLCKNCNLKLLSCYENNFPPQHRDSPRLNEYLSKGKLQ